MGILDSLNPVWVLVAVGPFILLVVYTFLNDAALTRAPDLVQKLSPHRVTDAEIDAVSERMENSPVDVREVLPPKTGRRYIVTGGAGFVGGYIVNHLILRGEDPKSIRIVDLRPPTRKDLLTGPALEVQFVQVDITNADAVKAAFTAPWNDSLPAGTTPEITVFHTAAIIRFFDRQKAFLPLSWRVNVNGTQNVVDACKEIGATILVSTSSCSVGVRATNFFLWPFRNAETANLAQVIRDDLPVPETHGLSGGNYPHTKLKGELVARAADKSTTSKGTILRTGTLRPGNVIYGPGADMFELLFITKDVVGYLNHIFSTYLYVENCSLAHLFYEQRLIELGKNPSLPDIGGQAFTVTNPGPATKSQDLNYAFSRFSKGEIRLSNWSPSGIVILAHIVEKYLQLKRAPILKYILPPMTGIITYLTPATMNVSLVHQILDDSRARLPPEKGGLGYTTPWNTLEGAYASYKEFQKNGPLSPPPVSGLRHGN